MAIVVTGMADLQKKMAEASLVVLEAAREAVKDITIEVSKKSQEVVPFDTGALARSMTLDLPKVLKDKPEGKIGYGGTAAPYAVMQHEMPNYWHPPKPPGRRKVSKKSGSGPTAPGTKRPKGGPKYLEEPLKNIGGVGFENKLLELINKYIKLYA